MGFSKFQTQIFKLYRPKIYSRQIYSRQSSMKNLHTETLDIGAINTVEPSEYSCAACGQRKGYTGICQVKISYASSSNPEYWTFD